MSRILSIAGFFLITSLSLEQAALAQTTPATAEQMPVALSFTGGLSTGSQDMGGAFGGTLNYAFNDRLELEGTGIYLDRGIAASALSLGFNLQLNLRPAGARAVPYAIAGAGVYRASFDLGHHRFFGDVDGRFGPDAQMVPLDGRRGFGIMQGRYTGPATWSGPWSGPTFTSSQMPMFYAQRMGSMAVPADSRWGSRTFTDPALTFGGGIDLALTPRLFVRPDGRAIMVIADGDTYTVGLFSFSFGVRF